MQTLIDKIFYQLLNELVEIFMKKDNAHMYPVA